MSQEENALSRAHTYITQVLRKIPGGTKDRPRWTLAVDLALDHADQWASTQTPSRDSSRGGSSSPPQLDEAQENRRVHELALKAQQRIPQIARQMDELGRELYDLVQRCSVTIDLSKLPTDTLPGCRSCARVENPDTPRAIGGHFAPVYEKSVKAGLCRWCWEYAQANNGELPPVKAVDVLHRQTPSAASRWLTSASQLRAS